MACAESAAKFLKKLFGKSKKAPPQDQVKKAFDFLQKVNMVYSKDDSGRMLKAFKAGEASQAKYDAKEFIQIDCRWKSDHDYQRMMIHAAIGKPETHATDTQGFDVLRIIVWRTPGLDANQDNTNGAAVGSQGLPL